MKHKHPLKRDPGQLFVAPSGAPGRPLGRGQAGGGGVGGRGGGVLEGPQSTRPHMFLLPEADLEQHPGDRGWVPGQ